MTNQPATYHFISGLPRSGSTLLAALLRQNPRFHADIISPVEDLIRANLAVMSASHNAAGQFSTTQRQHILHNLVQGYYTEIAQQHELIFDTNRGWTARLPLLHTLYPQAKVICCVRDTAEILNSLERILRQQPLENSRLFRNDAERETVFSRTAALTQPSRLVGFAWSALKEAYYGEHSSKLLLVDYETLARMPAQVMPAIYEFLEEEPFQHNFNAIAFDRPEFDQQLGVSGMHTVRSSVTFREQRNLLPPELIKRYSNQTFWDDPGGSAARVIRIRK